MARPRLPEHLLQEVVDAFDASGRSRVIAARSLDMPLSRFNKRLGIAAQRGLDKGNPPDGFEVASVSETRDAQGNLKSRSVMSKREPGDVLEVPEGQSLTGLSALVDQDNRVKLKWVKLGAERVSPVSVIETVKAVAETIQPVPIIAAPKSHRSDMFGLLPLADMHGGQLSWGRETGRDRDLSIAKEEMLDGVSDVTARSTACAEAAFVFMGDTFHADDTTARTPASKHQLDTDSRHQKVVWDICAGAIECIRIMASKHAKLHVRVIPGNHDPHASQSLALGLYYAFADDPRVNVSDDPSAWWFHQWGVNMFGAHHGDKMKPSAMPGRAAALAHKMWGDTRFRYFFHGHHHRRSVVEADGGLVMGLPAMTSPDAWAASGGLTSARGITAFEFHRHTGPVGSIDRLSPPVGLRG